MAAALLLLCVGSAAAALHTPSLPRREALRLAAIGGTAASAVLPAVADDAPVKLSVKQIEGKLAKIPVVALVNDEDAPFLTGEGGKVGYFFLDPTEALLSLRVLQRTSPGAKLKVVTLPEVYFNLVRGDSRELGGELRLRPSRRQVVLANRALQSNVKSGTFMPTILDEAKGQVPVFYSERVAFGSEGSQTFPFFLVKEDLDAAYNELVASGSIKGGGGTEGGIPIGLVRTATLDGLVDQMLSGAVDLSQAVVVGSRQALVTVGQIVKEMDAK